jgi:3-dehydroquinate synthase
MTQGLDPLAIKSAQGVYPVVFDATIVDLCEALAAQPRSLVIIDRKVAGLYREALAPLLAGRPVHEVDATEDEKTLEGCTRALKFMQANNASRQSRVVAIGGGIVQDITTFCAHVYYRGVKWVYVPTTLLGMADSCIGAKASINFNGFKNQLGVFHSPAEVRICLEFLETLPDIELASGYGEIVKLHLVGSREQFADLSKTLNAQGWRNDRLAEFIRASLSIKKAVIEVDEFDDGVRRILNFGHTFGHALEAVTDHGIPHGLAVAWGMDLCNYIALRRGLLGEEDFSEIHRLLELRFPHTLKRPIDARALLSATLRDKKIRDNRLTLILLKEPGTLEIVPQDYGADLESWVGSYLANLTIAKQ